MKLATKNFGEIDADENKVITFEDGLPGFPQEKKFIILREEAIAQSDPSAPEGESAAPQGLFCWLQSIQNGDLAFVLMNACSLLDDYDPMIEEEELKSIGEGQDSDFLIYNIAIIPDNIQNIRVNLRAPLVINTVTRLGRQFVLSNEAYAVQHYLFASRPDDSANPTATLEK